MLFGGQFGLIGSIIGVPVFAVIYDTVDMELPNASERYTLSANSVRSSAMLLNGKPLTLNKENQLPELIPVNTAAGKLTLAPATCTFLVF